MVQELLELKTKMDDIISKAFQDNVKFFDILRDSFESVVNRRQNKPAELIGKGRKQKICGLPLIRSLMGPDKVPWIRGGS